MKKLIYLTLFVGLVFASCEKEAVTRSLETDKEETAIYLEKYNIDVEPSSTGVYYIEEEKGASFPADSGDFLIYKYDLYTIGEQLIEEGEEYYFMIGQDALIPGLIEGLMQMNEGGKAKLIIPPHMAFGDNKVEDIDENTTLVMDVELLWVKGHEVERTRMENYLVENNVTVDPTDLGVYIITTKEGNGNPIVTGDLVSIAYEGTILGGDLFAATDTGDEMSYVHNQTSVIDGFQDALAHMEHGEEATVIIPYEAAYGAKGTYGIYPYSSLIFELKLTD